MDMGYTESHRACPEEPHCMELSNTKFSSSNNYPPVLTRFRLVINESTAQQMLCIGLSYAQYDGFCTDSILSELFYA